MNIDLSATGKKYWGRVGWGMIHTMASICDASDRPVMYTKWVTLMASLLPCADCRNHFTVLLTEHPLSDTPKSAHRCLDWSYMLHRQVNDRLEKPSPYLSSVRSFYRASRVSNQVFLRPLLKHWIEAMTHVYVPSMGTAIVEWFALTLLILPESKFQQRLNRFLDTYDIKYYLSNSYDLFYFTYIMHVYISRSLDMMSDKEGIHQARSRLNHIYGITCKGCQK